MPDLRLSKIADLKISQARAREKVISHCQSHVQDLVKLATDDPMKYLTILLLTALGLASCRDGANDLATCGADALQELVGQSPEMMGMVDIPMEARMLGPDSAATTDFRPERLNLSYDEDGAITRVWCG